MERSLPLESTHEASGASLAGAMGYRLPTRYTDSLEEYGHLRERVGVVDRSCQGVVSVTGSEASVLLDRVLSSAVTDLVPGASQLSALLTPRGKIVGVFDTFRIDDDDYSLRFRDPLGEDFLGALQKYAFLNDVQTIDDSGEKCLLAVEGPDAAGVVTDVLGLSLPMKEGCRREEVAWESDLAVVHDRGGERSVFELEFLLENAEKAWTVLVEAARARGGGPVGHAADEIVRVEEGRPRFGVDFTQANFPTETGHQSALTYTKCYVGQEVVARMKTYGHANRELRGIEFPGVGPEVATDLVGGTLIGDEDDVGTITSSVVSPRHGTITLSLVRRSHWSPGTRLKVGVKSGELDAVVRALPFVSS